MHSQFIMSAYKVLVAVDSSEIAEKTCKCKTLKDFWYINLMELSKNTNSYKSSLKAS